MRPRILIGVLGAGLGLAALAAIDPGAWTPAPPAPVPDTVLVSEPETDESRAAATRRQAISLRRGDNLVTALLRGGLDSRIGHEIAAALKRAGANLRRLKPQDTVEITWDLAGEPVAVSWEPSPWLGYAVISTADGWTVERSETRPDVRVESVRGRVGTSLFQAMETAGEAPGLVLAFVSIFESDFDFTADTRSGDQFRLLVEKRYADGRFVDYGRVLAAQYLNDGKMLTGVGYESRNGRFTYFDLQGQSLKKSFLKSPLEFSRITSGFTYARPHPVLGGVRPHLAIDYAAPVGTPVRAVADAVVVQAGWKGGNGISVLLRHRRGYETMYNHLSRLASGIRAGVRVAQRQVIGYVGSTGLSTGPHLDYRVAKNGRFVNPLNEKFLPGEPIAVTERSAFTRHGRALIERLEREAAF